MSLLPLQRVLQSSASNTFGGRRQLQRVSPYSFFFLVAVCKKCIVFLEVYIRLRHFLTSLFFFKKERLKVTIERRFTIYASLIASS